MTVEVDGDEGGVQEALFSQMSLSNDDEHIAST